MKKKVFITLMCLLVALAFVSASEHYVTAQISPFSFESTKINSENFPSKYGFGFKAGYRYNVWDHLTVGADLTYQGYTPKTLGASMINVLGLKARVGYFYPINDQFYVEAGLGAGADLRIQGSEKKVNFAAAADVSGGYKFNEQLTFMAGADFKLGFEKKNDVNATRFEIVPMLGATYAL